MLTRTLIIIAAFAVVLAVPFVMRPGAEARPADALQLVAISPHNEAIRYEFERGFSDWHQARYGRPVTIDWRALGGTSEIVRYYESEYTAAFRLLWTRTLGRPWTAEVAGGFNNDKLDAKLAALPPGQQPTDPALAARKAFLESDVGIGIDLFFGGGSYDHNRAARKGYLVDAGLLEKHPDWFAPEVIPQSIGGETYYDEKGRWYGACLSTFGLCHNRDSLERLGIEKPPTQWAHLANGAYFKQIGLADPTKSGSITKAFEMIVQQQMHQAVDARKAAAGDAWTPEMEREAVAEGFFGAMRLIQRIAGNARYFTDGASTVVTDVSDGNAAAGMCIDFYGRFQAESVAGPDGESRLAYVSPVGGTSVSADPVAVFRGASHGDIARRFAEFVLSIDGQKLWNYRVGTPGGPMHYSLRRLPVRRDMYTPEHRQYMADAKEEPYELAAQMTYRGDWTGPMFNFLRVFIQTMALEPHRELQAAWRAILENGGPEGNPEAMQLIGRMPLTFDQIRDQDINDPIRRMTLTRKWAMFFKKNYDAARKLAEQGCGVKGPASTGVTVLRSRAVQTGESPLDCGAEDAAFTQATIGATPSNPRRTSAATMECGGNDAAFTQAAIGSHPPNCEDQAARIWTAAATTPLSLKPSSLASPEPRQERRPASMDCGGRDAAFTQAAMTARPVSRQKARPCKQPQDRGTRSSSLAGTARPTGRGSALARNDRGTPR